MVRFCQLFRYRHGLLFYEIDCLLQDNRLKILDLLLEARFVLRDLSVDVLVYLLLVSLRQIA